MTDYMDVDGNPHLPWKDYTLPKEISSALMRIRQCHELDRIHYYTNTLEDEIKQWMWLLSDEETDEV